MKLKNFTILLSTCLATYTYADVWRVPAADIQEADWQDSTTWVGGTVPETNATVSLDKQNSITNITSDTTINTLKLYSGILNVSSGTFNVSYRSFVYAGEFNLFGDAEMITTDVFNTGDFGSLQYISDTEAKINVYGNAKLTDNHWGVLIGEGADLQNVVANFYGNSTITTSNSSNGIKIGASKSNTTSATSVLNVYENSTVNASTLYFYRNATLNVYDNATFNVSQKAYIGDTNNTSSIANMNLKGTSQTTLSNYSFIFNDANLSVSENASLTLKQNLMIGTSDNTNSSNTTSGHLILKDNAKLIQDNHSLIMYGDDSTIELHGSNIKVADGKSYMTKCLGNTAQADSIGTGGTIKFIADKDGISTFVVGYIEYNDSANQTSYAIELDFTNFAPASGEGSYTFNILTSINNWNNREAGIISNYFTEAELGNEDLVKITKANDEDTYTFFTTNGGKTFGINYSYVPEPSTYAMIFGALALAFAAYRKRN